MTAPHDSSKGTDATHLFKHNGQRLLILNGTLYLLLQEFSFFRCLFIGSGALLPVTGFWDLYVVDSKLPD